MYIPQLTGDFHHRRVQTKTRFDRDHHQVQRVSQTPAQISLPVLCNFVENETRNEEAGYKRDDDTYDDVAERVGKPKVDKRDHGRKTGHRGELNSTIDDGSVGRTKTRVH